MKSALLSLLLVLSLQPAYGQAAGNSAKFPGEDVIYLSRLKKLELYMERDSLKTKAYNEEVFLFREDVPGSITHRIYYSDLRKVKDVKAFVKKEGDKKFTEVKDLRFNVTRLVRKGIFYDDTYYYEYIFPSLSAGSTLKVSYTDYTSEPYFIHPYYFATEIPAEVSEYILIVPDGVDASFGLVGDSGQIVRETSEGKGFTQHSWKQLDVEGFQVEDRARDYAYELPHVVASVNEYKAGGVTKRVFGDLQSFYAWSRAHVSKIANDDLSAVHAVTDSLMAGCSSRTEMLERIYYWVQDNISYIAFEDGYSGYIPRKASQVYLKRYGDCKDMANLLVLMLRHAGFRTFHTWIGTSSIPYDIEQVFTPYAYNHMIGTVEVDGEYFFLDATSRFQPLSLPTSFIQGKKGLLGTGDSTYMVVEIPIIPAEKNYVSDSVALTLDIPGNTVRGVGSMMLYGYPKVEFSYMMAGNNRTNISQSLASYLLKGNNKFLLEDYQVSPVTDRSRPVSVGYRFVVGNYLRRLDGELIINLNMVSYQSYSQKFTDRKSAVDFGNTEMFRDIYSLEVPEGYEVASLPPDSGTDYNGFGYKQTYRQNGNYVIHEVEIYNNLLVLPAGRMEDWNSFAAAFIGAQKQNVVLTKIR